VLAVSRYTSDQRTPARPALPRAVVLPTNSFNQNRFRPWPAAQWPCWSATAEAGATPDFLDHGASSRTGFYKHIDALITACQELRKATGRSRCADCGGADDGAAAPARSQAEA